MAMVDGAPVQWMELRPALLEAAGGQALQDLALDRRLAIELRKRGLAVDQSAIDRERQLLLESIAADRNTAARLLEELRRRDGLGPVRFDALLVRNASLRMLVADEVRITPETLAQARDLATGPRRQVRLITLPSLTDCDAALRRLDAGESFSDVAVEVSTDRSAARGGLLEPFARADVTYPQALREAVFALAPGQVSSPILLENGYAIAVLVRELPGAGATSGDLERAVRLAQERLLMDQLARRLLRETRITVLDDDLNDSWKRFAAPGNDR
ncbi:MAG: peptidylprolyl isomerase [Phycisphaerales bacterium]|nr:peptidylprolyl isomerase [Phycisphaerales bacterium]